MPGPRAYLLTWTTSGAWLHGDARGSVDDLHNSHDTPRLAANADTLGLAKRLSSEEPLILDDEARRIVDGAIRERCAFLGATVHALNVRTNHVHAVVTKAGASPESLLQTLKAWSTRALRQREDLDGRDRFWTRHGSTRYLWDQRSVEEACRYVVEGQDRRGASAG